MANSLGALSYLTFVLLIIIFIFAVMGNQLFKQKYLDNVCNKEWACVMPRWHFVSFFMRWTPVINEGLLPRVFCNLLLYQCSPVKALTEFWRYFSTVLHWKSNCISVSVSWLCFECCAENGSRVCGTACMWLDPPAFPTSWPPSSSPISSSSICSWRSCSAVSQTWARATRMTENQTKFKLLSNESEDSSGGSSLNSNGKKFPLPGMILWR